MKKNHASGGKPCEHRKPGALAVTTGSADWTDRLKPGDDIIVSEKWNSTTLKDKIAVPTKALDIKRGTRSQSGVLIRVATALRDDAWLDAAWFVPNAADEGRR